MRCWGTVPQGQDDWLGAGSGTSEKVGVHGCEGLKDQATSLTR